MVNDLVERGISIADYKSIIENNEKTIKITLVKDNQPIELQGGGDMELKYIISKKKPKKIIRKKLWKINNLVIIFKGFLPEIEVSLISGQIEKAQRRLI